MSSTRFQKPRFSLTSRSDEKLRSYRSFRPPDNRSGGTCTSSLTLALLCRGAAQLLSGNKRARIAMAQIPSLIGQTKARLKDVKVPRNPKVNGIYFCRKVKTRSHTLADVTVTPSEV